MNIRLPGEEIGGGGMNGGGGENGGDPGQGRPVTGPHRSKLLAKLQTEQVIKQSSNQSVNNLI